LVIYADFFNRFYSFRKLYLPDILCIIHYLQSESAIIYEIVIWSWSPVWTCRFVAAEQPWPNPVDYNNWATSQPDKSAGCEWFYL